MSDSLRALGLQHTRLPCPSLSPTVCSNSHPLSQWCYPTISSSVALFSCPQSFPASGSFPMSQLYSLGAQSIGAFIDEEVKFCKTLIGPCSWLIQNWIGIRFLPVQRFFHMTWCPHTSCPSVSTLKGNISKTLVTTYWLTLFIFVDDSLRTMEWKKAITMLFYIFLSSQDFGTRFLDGWSSVLF